jgi:hypothetical protein
VTALEPRIGSTVAYTLSIQDAQIINRQRRSVDKKSPEVYRGETYPMEITRIWGSTPDAPHLVDGKVVLGHDTHLVSLVKRGIGPNTWSW